MNLNHKHYFVTGTDTGIGKTHVTAQLIRALKAQGQTALGLKPIASGGVQGQNEDALIYLEENSLALPYHDINPFFFEKAVSPHLAARFEGKVLTASAVTEQMQPALQHRVDHIFIEGAGGVYAPLSDNETMLDLMKAFDIPVILVVGLRLGCLNHALLSFHALKSAGLHIAGWVANPIDPSMECLAENVQTLKENFDTIKLINPDICS